MHVSRGAFAKCLLMIANEMRDASEQRRICADDALLHDFT